MSLKNKILLKTCFALLLAACRKAEIPVKPMDRGDAIISSVDMNADYKNQLFFSLSDNLIVSSNMKTAWDLAFECLPSGFHIRINTSKAMAAANTSKTVFAQVTDTSNFSLNKQFDSPTGNPDSTAFGDWRSTQPVYIVDRGFNESGAQQGYRKIQVLSSTSADFTIKVADISGANEVTVMIPKNPAKNYVCFSFASNSVVNIEPDKEAYDLLFSQYTHIYSDPFSTYLVTGVLCNPGGVKIAPIGDTPFSDIVIGDTIAHPFSTFQNTIGYDWKTYNFQTSSYLIETTKCYIIKSTKGFYYKLHFIDFYNSVGIKGCPKFEFKKL